MDRDSDIPPDPSEPTKASPAMVDRIVKGIAVGVNTALIQGQTTQADLLSAMFTVLWRMLENAKAAEDPDEAEKNAREVGRVLISMLHEFGTSARVQ